MADLKGDIINILISFFGEDIGSLVYQYYDIEQPNEIIELCEEMLSELLGDDNARKQLEPIYIKYNIKGGLLA